MSKKSPKSKQHTMSLRLTKSEHDRIVDVTSFYEQSISDFIRTCVRVQLEVEELKIMKIKAEKYELEQRINSAKNKK